ncbi:MAG TPA: site-2 protease family protein [Thermoplasmata archaeon]
MDSPAAEIEAIRTVVAKYFTVYGVVVTPLALTFQVTSPSGSIDAPFDALRQELVPRDYIPTVTQERGETLLHVQRRPRMRFARRQVNLLLLLLTIPSIVFFGGAWNWSAYSGEPILSAASIGYGSLFFSLPLLTILGSHEMGHFLVAKKYKVHASLPFFLPSLPPLGTLGAFISMRDPIPNRRALLDIGVSGPLVGFAIAIPVTLAGLALSTGTPPVVPTVPGEAIQGSLLFNFLSLFFPLPNPVLKHPLAFAGWVGLFVTAINLLPAGQLDGGHIARALFGRNQFYLSWAAILLLFIMSAWYIGWIFFAFLILMLGARHPPPLNDITRLDAARKLVGIGAVAILFLTFVPVPFVAIGGGPGLTFEKLDGSPLVAINQTIRIGATIGLTRFAVNHTAAASEIVVVTAKNPNLASFGFSFQFLDVVVGSTNTTVNNDTVRVELNASERALLDLQITAPPSWPVPLPATVRFEVHATTLRETATADLVVILDITP